MSINSKDDKVYSGNQDGFVDIIDVKTNKILKTIEVVS